MFFKVEGICPKCSTKGKSVALNKMIIHVNDISKVDGNIEHYVCKNSSCDVVYFNIKSNFLVNDINKEIGYKDSASTNGAVCYCYGVKKSELNDSTIEMIESKMELVPRSCGTRNPYTVCCVGEIKKMLKAKE